MNKELEFYKSYHNNIINKWIHFFCIPMIVSSIIILLNNFYVLYENNKLIKKIKLSSVIMSFYIISYSFIGWDIGLLMSFYFILLNSISNYIIVNHDYISIARYMFIYGWIFQFIGHYIEGKRPALIDSISQSFYQAPLFSLEVIYPQLLKI